MLLLASSIIFIVCMWFFYTKFFGAEFAPAPKKVIEKMIEFAELKNKDIVYDLGCGDGRILIKAAGKCRKAIGIEIDLLRVLISKFKTRKIKNVKIIRGNLFLESIKDADVIFIFLRQKANDALMKKFKKELKKGSRIISHYWTLPLKAYKTDENLRVYAYKI